MNDYQVNSESYWDERFRENWDASLGRVQSQFFGRIAVEMMPDWLRRAIRANQWTTVDWGCAEGDGTQVIAESFGMPVCGIDFSEEAIVRARETYPDIEFRVENWLEHDQASNFAADVVFSSNTLEHFHSPWKVFRELAARARRFVVLLLPFREFQRHFEHFATFDFGSVPWNIDGFSLVNASVYDAAKVANTQWPGEQILLIYARPEEAAALNLSLQDITITNKSSIDHMTAMESASAEALELKSSSAVLRGQIAMLEKELEGARNQMHSVEYDRATWISRCDQLGEKLKFDAEATERLKFERDSLSQKVRELERQHDDLGSQCAALESRLREAQEKLEQADQREGIQALEQRLSDRMSELSTQIEHLRGALETASASRGAAKRTSDLPRGRLRRALHRVRRDGIVRAVLYAGSRSFRSRAATWYGYQFDVFRRSREQLFPSNWEKVIVPCDQGMVSIVLPVFNGEDMVAESIDSVLGQTYSNFELIIIDDGSTDGTGAILDAYAARDSRVRVIHQENRRLPRTLSRGFRNARGEFLTWTSADNRMKPTCLERMVEAMQSDRTLDMIYANLDIIGPDGKPLTNSGWYQNYQMPQGSEHIHFPRYTDELNTWANNFIGACFMYRSRVAALLRDYSAARFCTEDYDYWMRVNALFKLRHVGIDEPLYEYRFHPNSLTSQDKALRITENRTRLMVFEDFRRSFMLTPGVWLLECQTSNPSAERMRERLASQLKRGGHVVVDSSEFAHLQLANHWVSVARVCISDQPSAALPLEGAPGQVQVLLALPDVSLPEAVDPRWTWCVALQPAGSQVLPRLGVSYQGWAGVEDESQLLAAIDVLAKEQQLAIIEEEAEHLHYARPEYELDASIIICTYRRSASLPDALHSALAQTLPSDRYEVIVVNNEPGESYPRQICGATEEVRAAVETSHLRLIDCPVRGLSHARNAGLSASRGRVLLFLDDDAIAEPDCLETLLRAYVEDPSLGVVGGHIVLAPPDPTPGVLVPGREGLWSHFVTNHTERTVVTHWYEYPWGANWSATREALFSIGGFRANFGRAGNDYGGGEEIVAAALVRQLGLNVAVEPNASVRHHVESKRFTVEHVRKTVLAGIMTNYRMQKAMYLPFESSFIGNSKLIALDAYRRARAIARTLLGRGSGEADALLASALRRARRFLWREQFSDRVARLRRTIVQS